MPRSWRELGLAAVSVTIERLGEAATRWRRGTGPNLFRAVLDQRKSAR